MSKLVKFIKTWSRAAGITGLFLGTGLYAAYPTLKVKYQRFSEKTVSVPDIPDLEVTYKYLPQYGPNFKVKQCSGYNLPDFVDVNAVRKFASRSNDIWIVSYPKSGTTWVQEIVYLLIQKHHFHWSMTEALKKALRSNLDDRVPFIEFPCPGIKTIDELKSPRIIKSHLPLQLLPPSALQTPSVKIIYVTRNPRDVAVSLYHFMDMLTEVQMAENFGFSDFVEDFLSGDLPYSPYSAHVASYVKALDVEGLDRKVLVLRYEDLKKDWDNQVERIELFLGVEPLEEGYLKWIRHYTTFDVMKDQPTSNYSWFNDLGIIKKGRTFIRKGKVGEWEDYLTEEQAERFKNQIEAPLEDSVYHRNPLKLDK